MEEVEIKEPIEEVARQLLIWKVKGGNVSHIIDDANILEAGIKYLIDNEHIERKENSNPCEYKITLKGFEHVYGVWEDIQNL